MSGFRSRVSAVLLMVTFAGVVACNAGDRPGATIPNPAVDATLATTILGHSGRLPAREGCDQRNLRLFRRRNGHRGIRTGEQR